MTEFIPYNGKHSTELFHSGTSVPVMRGTELAIVAAIRTRKRPGRKALLRPDLDLGRTAKALGISPSYLCQLLRGRRKPSFELSFRLAEALGFSSVEELRGWLAIYHAQWEAWNRMEITTKEIWETNVVEPLDFPIPPELQP